MNPNAIHPATTDDEFATLYGVTTTEAYQEVPVYLCEYADAISYGNVYTVLRFGLLLIENGVRYMLWGALITSRDPPSLQILRNDSDNGEHSLLIAGGSDRVLYS
jgi:hypothetical protein